MYAVKLQIVAHGVVDTGVWGVGVRKVICSGSNMSCRSGYHRVCSGDLEEHGVCTGGFKESL